MVFGALMYVGAHGHGHGHGYGMSVYGGSFAHGHDGCLSDFHASMTSDEPTRHINDSIFKKILEVQLELDLDLALELELEMTR